MCMCICAQMEGGVCVGGRGGGETYSVFTWVGLIPVKGCVHILLGGSEILSFYASNQLCQHQEGLG